jgi:ribonuclease HII
MVIAPSGGRLAMPDYAVESALRAQGAAIVAGVDEVGRGPLAGPVVAAAVVLDAAALVEGLNDSKQLKRAERERLFVALLATAEIGLCALPPAEIDRINIRNASLEAMRRAVAALRRAPDHVLVDGRDIPHGLPCPATAIVGGDGRSLSIAAASIVAKVVRDRLMDRLGDAFAGYGFARHAGYPTAAHRAAIARLGPSPHHRLSFRPFRNDTPST